MPSQGRAEDEDRMATLEVACFENELPKFWDQVSWRTWLECEDGDSMLAGLAAHRHVRERGGVQPDQTLKLFVCIRKPGELTVNYTQFKVTKGEL
jgi:hypothetical protein